MRFIENRKEENGFLYSLIYNIFMFFIMPLIMVIFLLEIGFRINMVIMKLFLELADKDKDMKNQYFD